MAEGVGLTVDMLEVGVLVVRSAKHRHDSPVWDTDTDPTPYAVSWFNKTSLRVEGKPGTWDIYRFELFYKPEEASKHVTKRMEIRFYV